MSTNNKWGALSMRDRAFLIREAVRNGITDINSIRDTWEHRFDGGSNQPTEDEYIAKQAQNKINKALHNARSAEDVPELWIEKNANMKTSDNFRYDNAKKELEDAKKELQKLSLRALQTNIYGPETFDNEMRRYELRSKIPELETTVRNYQKLCDQDLVPGFTCINTVTSYYDRPETWNVRFAKQHEQKGFKKIPYSEIAPGDIVQFKNSDNNPTHALMANTAYTPNSSDMRYNGSNGQSGKEALRINAKYPTEWDEVDAYRYVGNKADSLQWKKEYREKYGHQFSGEESIIERALGLYNPWSPESMVAKASSPVVEEGLFDINTARKAVIENDKEARKDLEAANALALTGSLVGASIVPSIVAAGAGTSMAVPLLTAKPFKHKLASKAASFIGSLVGGELINKASEKQTGKTVGENIFNAIKPALPEKWQENPYINDYVGPILGEFLNPAYPIGSRVLPNLGAKSIRGANMAAQEAKNAAKRTAEVIVRMGDEASIPRSVRKQLINKESLSYIFNPKASKSAYNLPFKYSGQNAAPHAAPAHPDDIVDVYFGKSDKLTAYSPDSGTTVNIPVITTSRTDSRLPEGARRWLEKNGKDEVKLLLLGDLPLSPVEVRRITRRITNNGSSPVYMGETSGAVKGALGEAYIDPGGFNRIARRNGNIIEVNDFDIWKFTAPEYDKKYFGPRMLLEDYSGPSKFHQWKKFMGDALQRRLKNLGLKFIDKQGTPIVTMWHSDFPYPENLTSTPIVDYDAIKAGTDYNPEAFSILKDILNSKK